MTAASKADYHYDSLAGLVSQLASQRIDEMSARQARTEGRSGFRESIDLCPVSGCGAATNERRSADNADRWTAGYDGM